MLLVVVPIILFIVLWQKYLKQGWKDWYEQGRFWLCFIPFIVLTIIGSWGFSALTEDSDRYVLYETMNYSLHRESEEYKKDGYKDGGLHIVERLENRKGEVFYEFSYIEGIEARTGKAIIERMFIEEEYIDLVYDSTYIPHLEIQAYTRPETRWWLSIAHFEGHCILYCDENTEIRNINNSKLEN